MAAGKRRKKNNMMSVLFIPPANMRHKNVKNEKKHKLFNKKHKNLLLYPQTIFQTRQNNSIICIFAKKI